MNRPDIRGLPIEWQNFYHELFIRVGGESAPTNLELMEKSGSLSQLTSRDHGDLQGLGDDDHPQYTRKDHILAGSAIFGSTSGVTVSFPELTGRNYAVSITPTVLNGSGVGVISIHFKEKSSFKVYNSGADASSTFDWILVDKNE